MKRSLLTWGVLALVAAVPGPAQQGVEQFTATLSGVGATPPVTTNGVGVATMFVSNGTLTYRLEGKSIKGVVAACIHMNTKAAPVVVGLSVGSPDATGFVGTGTVSASDVSNISFDEFLANLRAGKAYVSVHTEKYPGGEIQGKVSVVKS